MGGSIFISYRRDDSAPWAGRLYERLSRDYSKSQLFMDVDKIGPGADFVKVLGDQVASCDVFLCIVGKHWSDARNDRGERRLDDPGDFVRIEVESALKRNISTLPLLVDGARMPKAEDLPENMKSLARLNAIEISHARFESDVASLVKTIGKGTAKVGISGLWPTLNWSPSKQPRSTESKDQSTGSDAESEQQGYRTHLYGLAGAVSTFAASGLAGVACDLLGVNIFGRGGGPEAMRTGFILGPLVIGAFAFWQQISRVLTVSRNTFMKSALFSAVVLILVTLSTMR